MTFLSIPQVKRVSFEASADGTRSSTHSTASSQSFSLVTFRLARIAYIPASVLTAFSSCEMPIKMSVSLAILS